ncbi:MAG TPA: rRNA maturation RNase YbeY [Nitrospira sp.]
MPVFFRSHLSSITIDRARLSRLAQRVLSEVGESTADVCLSLIGDRRMRALNLRFRGKDRSTDVLAFAARGARTPHATRQPSRPLGDVVISVPTALRQAKRGQRSLDEEIVTLLVHGILHLCGYDHERSEGEALRMQRRERIVRRTLGRIPRFVRRGTRR